MSHETFGTYTKKLFVIYLKLKYNFCPVFYLAPYTDRWSNLPKITEPASDRARIETRQLLHLAIFCRKMEVTLLQHVEHVFLEMVLGEISVQKSGQFAV